MIRRLTAALSFPATRVLLVGADLAQAAAVRNPALFRLAGRGSPRALDWLSERAAVRAARHAIARVPAYREFLAQEGWADRRDVPPATWLRQLPETDKDGYIRRFAPHERCLDGRIPMAGTIIDESAGSSGIPYNWVRSSGELRELHLAFQQYVRLLFGSDLITINGFSMGAWATGTNVGEALRGIGMVKSTGPDIDRIEGTLRFFGPRYRYLITGYPPFLKELADATERRGLDWSSYQCHGIVGGEGMTEELRDHLQRRFRTVYSAYGASDLDIGVASELPATVAIRRLSAQDADLRRDLFGDHPRLPMVFQYNPMTHHVETNEAGELVVTVNRLTVLSPRIRYNVHDSGGVLAFDRAVEILRDHGHDTTPITQPQRGEHAPFRLPIMYLFGRSDSTVSYMGANIYPEDVELAIYADDRDAARIRGFCMELIAAVDGQERPALHVEVVDGRHDDEALASRVRRRVVHRLLAVNRDFAAAVGENPATAELDVRLHAAGTGPFEGAGQRVKRRYVIRPPSAT